MASKPLIPSPDLRVRIINTESRLALYSNARDKLGLNHVDISIPYRDQYWYVRPGQGKNAGLYLIVSDYNDRAIYVDFENGLQWGPAGTSAPAGSSDLQYFDLAQQQGKGIRAGQFRIYNPTNDGVLFSRTNQQYEIGCVSNAMGTFNDQWFTFEAEPLELINIEFDLKNTVTESVRPVNIHSQEATNDTSEPQTPLIEVLKTTEQQYTFESEVGLELGISTKFSSGIPVAAKAEVKISAKIHTNLSWGIANSHSQTWKSSVPLNVPGHKTYKVTMTVTEYTIRVPFKAKWKSPATKKTIVTEGVFKGINSSELKTNYYEVHKTKTP
ncbi:hypothetical protein COCMIDRAFT_28563 [Bipolaris oryzae ATCC 44560]|uniref:Uncharacterized protein n=1 Tax=Bipolaris oryzae ATCC 44560 TaxID=930090 RepID=W6YZ60_COCMI|nr:uncharacterized protein COCMIDRAFT_28563 [Bipolaris oryzae ATCC 44560]EUC42880.1 hypothetical protein COCMIDRAFT_28563 [Bipolaris oryzae ATCC 44560]